MSLGRNFDKSYILPPMIYFIFIWILLIITTYPIGLVVMNQLSSESFGRLGDRFIGSVWLGILILTVSLLATSIALPLSPLVGFSVLIVLVGLSLLSSKNRVEISRLRDRLLPSTLWRTVLLAVVVAFLTTYQVTWIESGFYHYGSIRWLSEFGTVPGIVLILPNLGIISSWFALNAPLNGSIINFQAGAIANGFILFLAVLHWLICLDRLLAHRQKLSDYFAIAFYSLFFAYTALSSEMQLILVSPSPDLPTSLLVGIVCWGMLVILESESTEANSDNLKDSIVPLLLAGGAVTIKLSAVPLLVVAAILYVYRTKRQWRALLWGILLTSLLLLPIFLVGFQNSGCPLYPLPSFCLDVPWAQPIAETQKFADNTQDPAKWVKASAANRHNYLWVFRKWLESRALNQIMAGLGVISLLCLIYLLKAVAIAKLKSGIFWVSAVGFVGIAFITFKGPLIRFGLGYFLVLPAISIASYAQSKTWEIANWKGIGQQILGRWQVKAIALTVLSAVIAIGFGYGGLSSRWLLPPPVKSPLLVRKQVNDIQYLAALNASCWASPLPCTLGKRQVQAKLLDPSLGIKGGFARISVVENANNTNSRK